MDAFNFVQQCADLGVKLVQIADNIPLHEMSPIIVDELYTKTTELGIAVEVGTRGIAHEHLRKYLDIARQFDSPILRVVVDTSDHHPNPSEIIQTLRDMMPEFEQSGIILAIENHDRFQAQTLVHMIDQIGSDYVGICLDTVNSFGALEGPEIVIETLGPYVVNLHVKDFFIKRFDHNMGFTLYGTPAGKGMLNLPWLISRLKDFGRNYNAILELWPAPEANMHATVEKELAWAQESVGYLRRWFQD